MTSRDMDAWAIDILVAEMIESGFLEPDDDVLIQETREQLTEHTPGGDA